MPRLALAIILAVLTLTAARARAEERWHVLQFDGRKAGWSRQSSAADSEGRITTQTEMHFAFDRMGQKVEMRIATTFLESATGEPLAMSTAQKLGATEVRDEYTFIPGIAAYEILHVTHSAGGRTEKKLPWPEGDWLTPARAEKLIRQRLAAQEKEFSYTTLDPSIGPAPLTLHHAVIERDTTTEVMGKVVPALKWSVTNSALPGVVSHDYVDAEGASLRSEIDFGGMKLVMLASEKEFALSPFDAPEMMAQTLVKPIGFIPIARPRQVVHARYTLSTKDGSPMPDLPSIGGQTVERIGPSSVRITFERRRVSPDPRNENPEPDPYLAPSTAVKSDDPEIVRLAERCAAESPITLARCVGEYINDDSLGVGLATASEVVRTRRGDCTEHAVLLAAVLRARGIPSRVVSGLVYVRDEAAGDGSFGFHMWTQGLYESEDKQNRSWRDLDAAIPPHGDDPGVDATHIALAHSSLADGEAVNSMAALVGLLGRITIDIVTITTDPAEER